MLYISDFFGFRVWIGFESGFGFRIGFRFGTPQIQIQIQTLSGLKYKSKSKSKILGSLRSNRVRMDRVSIGSDYFSIPTLKQQVMVNSITMRNSP